MQQHISTKRLHLDLLTLADDAFIISLVNSKGWIEFIGERNVHSKEQAIAYISKIISTPDLFYWVVRVQATNTPIGIVSFLKRSYLDNFDIGFAFLPESNGQGYAFEAAKEVLLMLDRQQPLYHPVLATTVPSNVQSIKLLTRLGLHFEKEIEVDGERLLVYKNGMVAQQPVR
jgi:[ribosomal protein S5]-alanine N-acetyltransferase